MGIEFEVPAVLCLFESSLNRKSLTCILVENKYLEMRIITAKDRLAVDGVKFQSGQVSVRDQCCQLCNGSEQENQYQGHVVIKIKATERHENQHDPETPTEFCRKNKNMTVFQLKWWCHRSAFGLNAFLNPARYDVSDREECGWCDDRCHRFAQGIATWFNKSEICSLTEVSMPCGTLMR